MNAGKRNHYLKLSVLFLALVLLFSFSACGNGKKKASKENEALSLDKGAGTEQGQDENVEGEEDQEKLPEEQMQWLCVTKEEYDRDGELDERTELEYNEYGQVIQEISYTDGEESARVTYSYDENHALNGGTSSTTDVFLNAVEYCEREFGYNEYGFKSYVHEIKNVVYNEGEPYKDGTYEYEYEYFYDAEGTCMGNVEKTVGSDSFDISVWDYTNAEEVYNDEGLLIKEIYSYKMYEYEYDENGNVVKEIYTGNLGMEEEFSEVTLYTYEERLCKTVVPTVLPETAEMDVIYRAKSKDSEGNTLYSYYYLYDNRGRQVGAYGSNSSSYFGREYNEYDENGRVIRTRTSNLLADMIYDDAGNRIREEFREEEDGEIVVYGDCEYDSQGRLTRSTKHAVDSYYEDAEGSWQEYEYQDDQNDLVSTCRYYNGDGTLKGYEVYEYDNEGKVVSITSYDGDGNVTCITTPEYATITVLAD